MVPTTQVKSKPFQCALSGDEVTIPIWPQAQPTSNLTIYLPFLLTENNQGFPTQLNSKEHAGWDRESPNSNPAGWMRVLGGNACIWTACFSHPHPKLCRPKRKFCSLKEQFQGSWRDQDKLPQNMSLWHRIILSWSHLSSGIPYLPESRDSQQKSVVINLLPRAILILSDKTEPHPDRYCHKESYLPCIFSKGWFIFPKSHLHFHKYPFAPTTPRSKFNT